MYLNISINVSFQNKDCEKIYNFLLLAPININHTREYNVKGYQFKTWI